LFGKIREYLKGVLNELAKQRGCTIISGYIEMDYIHMCISIPPTYAVVETVGYLKGKSVITVARPFGGEQRKFGGENLRTHGFAVKKTCKIPLDILTLWKERLKCGFVFL